MIRTRCPICEGEMAGPDRSAWPEFPFCSPRCRLIDLGRWLGGKYQLATDPEEEEFTGDSPNRGSASRR